MLAFLWTQLVNTLCYLRQKIVLVPLDTDSFWWLKWGKQYESFCSFSRVWQFIYRQNWPFSCINHCNFPLSPETKKFFWPLVYVAYNVGLGKPQCLSLPLEIVFTLIERSREQLLCWHDNLILLQNTVFVRLVSFLPSWPGCDLKHEYINHTCHWNRACSLLSGSYVRCCTCHGLERDYFLAS